MISEQSVINNSASTPHGRKLATLAPAWSAGESGNPAGRPTGARHKLSERYLMDTYADWQEHGAEALVRCREKDPVAYCRMVAGLLPKQSAHIRANVSTTRPLDAVNADLVNAVRALGFTVTPADTLSVPAAGGASEAVAGLTQSSVGVVVQEQPLTSNIPESSLPVITDDVIEHGGQPSNSSVHDKS